MPLVILSGAYQETADFDPRQANEKGCDRHV